MNRDRQCLIAAAYIRDGKLRLADQGGFKEAIGRMHNCRAVIRLEEHLDPLSAALRAYWWGVVVRNVSEETGMNDREAHLFLKSLHTPVRFATVRGLGRVEDLKVFDSSITDLSNPELWEIVENVQQWAAERLDGLVIKDPESPSVVAA